MGIITNKCKDLLQLSRGNSSLMSSSFVILHFFQPIRTIKRSAFTFQEVKGSQFTNVCRIFKMTFAVLSDLN